MDKSVRTSLWKKLSTMMAEGFREFEPYKEKSVYIWPGELVFRSTELISPKTAFVIFSPETKGREQFTVELAWSIDAHFPKLTQRPSDVPAGNEKMLSRPQAAVRLPTIADPNGGSWIDVGIDTVDIVVRRVMEELVQHGIPYLRRVGRQ
jgi:hypothetical protein